MNNLHIVWAHRGIDYTNDGPFNKGVWVETDISNKNVFASSAFKTAFSMHCYVYSCCLYSLCVGNNVNSNEYVLNH